jgi:uncharacterized protein (UPF0248 family)
VRKNPLQEIINRIIWEKGDARIKYIDRKGEERIRSMDPGEIEKAGSSFIILRDGTMIPYHRLVLVEYRGKILYRRRDWERKWTGKNTS